MGSAKASIERASTIWFWRLCYLPPLVVVPLVWQFRDGVANTLERTRPEWILLPLPCVALKHGLDLIAYAGLFCVFLFILSFAERRISTAEAIAICYGVFLLMLIVELWMAILVIAIFLR